MPLRPSRARFRMGPRLREDDKKKTKETSRQEIDWERVECFCLQKACHTTDTNSAQIGYHYRATLTITVILANAGTHSSASVECFVSNSPYSGKHLQTKRQRPPLPSFSRTRETIRPRPPRVSLAKVLTAASIYKRRDNALQCRHSRERGNPFTRVRRVLRLQKSSQLQASTNEETTPPITIILANAGTHSSASAECFVSKSPHNDKHLQTKRQRPTITVILANAGTHSSAYAECFVSKSPYSDKHPKCRASKVNSVVPSTYNARFRMGPRLREDDKK